MKSVLDKAEKEEGERDKVLSLLQSVKCLNGEILHIVHVIKYKERLVFFSIMQSSISEMGP